MLDSKIHPILKSLPLLGLGTGGTPTDRIIPPVAAAVAAALKSGVTLIDCAQNYGELSVGAGLAEAGLRGGNGDAFVLSKVDLAPLGEEEPAARVRRQIARSLANLGRSKLDAVIFHWPICLDKVADEAEHAQARRIAWQALEQFVDDGVVGVIGCSNWTPELIDETLSYARIRPVINEVEFSPVCCQSALVKACSDRGVAVVGYSPYGTCWMSAFMGHCHKVPWHGEDTNLLGHEAVRAVAAEVGATPAQVLLRYSLQHNVVVIPKSSKPERIAESVGAFDISLSDAQMARLDALNDPRRGTAASVAEHLKIIAAKEYVKDRGSDGKT